MRVKSDWRVPPRDEQGGALRRVPIELDALVLAGGENSGKLREYDPAKYKALIDINGKPMVKYVLEAVRDCRYVKDIAVVAPEGIEQESPDILPEGLTRGAGRAAGEGNSGCGGGPGREVLFVRQGDTLFGSLRNGVAALGQNNPLILLVPGDLPLLQGHILDDFVERCLRRPAQLYYSFVSKTTNDARFPRMKRTYQRLVEGVLTGANLAIFEPGVLDACDCLIRSAILARKKPWLLLRIMGIECIIKYLIGRLSVSDIERRFRALTGLVGVGVESPYAEISCDVDKPSHLELVRRVLSDETSKE